MVDYKIVKYCGLCKIRFVVNKGENKKIYCDDCYAKVLKSREIENKENQEAQDALDAKAKKD